MKLILTIIFILLFSLVNAQFVAQMQLKEPLAGLCNDKEVYAIFPGFGDQQEAVSPVTKDELSVRLNSDIHFLKENPKFRDKGMVNIIINCKGEVIQCKMDRKTKSPELDQQIESVFNSLGEWKAATLSNKPVDSSKLFSFTIKNGTIALN